MALEDTVKIYNELRTDLGASSPLVTKSISASLAESEAVNHSIERKCWQMLQKKSDAYNKKIDAEQNSKLEKLHKELDHKNRVSGSLLASLLLQCCL